MPLGGSPVTRSYFLETLCHISKLACGRLVSAEVAPMDQNCPSLNNFKTHEISLTPLI